MRLAKMQSLLKEINQFCNELNSVGLKRISIRGFVISLIKESHCFMKMIKICTIALILVNNFSYQWLDKYFSKIIEVVFTYL